MGCGVGWLQNSPFPEATVAAAQKWAMQLDGPTTIVFDDYHQATSFSADEHVAELLETAPNLRIMTVGRGSTLFFSPLITARTPVRHVLVDDLTFTPSESLAITGDDALHAPFAGWPLGIQAASAATGRGASRDDAYAQIAEEAYRSMEALRARQILTATPGLSAAALTPVRSESRG